MDAGTTLRWPFGVSAAAHLKVDVLRGFAAANYPFVAVETSKHRIGNVHPGAFEEGFADRDRVDDFFDDLDLVIDASAEFGVQHLIADRAREREVPFLHMSGTHGGWGGLVFRVTPSRGCWYCTRHAIESGALPTPPQAPPREGVVQPTGCADPTFTGAGFDLAEVSLQGVRLAVATVSSGSSGYPDYSWDYAALTLREAGGELVAPKWETSRPPRNPDCPVCGC